MCGTGLPHYSTKTHIYSLILWKKYFGGGSGSEAPLPEGFPEEQMALLVVEETAS